MSEFSKVYSPNAMFSSLTLPELIKLRKAWFRQWDHYKGHELRVMRWNMTQLNRYIMVKQGADL